MHLLPNISSLGDLFHLERSLNSLYDFMCTTHSQKEPINSSEGPLVITEFAKFGFHKDTWFSHDLRIPNHITDMIACGCNLIAIAAILLNHRLRKPFYICILLLCVSDLFHFIQKLLYFYVPSADVCSVKKQQLFLVASVYTVKMFSQLNVILLASVRYVMFVYPLRSRVQLTNRLVVVVSVTALVFSIAYGTIMSYVISSIPMSTTHILYIADDVALLLVLVVLNSIFLIHRLRVAKASPAAQRLTLRMTLFAITIEVLHIIKSVVSIVSNTWRNKVEIGTEQPLAYGDPSDDPIILYVGDVLKKVIHFGHPFLFFLTSQIVSKRVASLLKKCKSTK
jgi:hypothetical protein